MDQFTSLNLHAVVNNSTIFLQILELALAK